MIAVGDLQPNREQPETIVSLVKDKLHSGDLTYCQLECTLSDRGILRTDVRNPAHRVPPHNVKALTAGKFDVVSYAGNNQLDYGTEAFLDTIELLKENHIEVVGAGRNLDEATRPVILHRNGLRIAFTNFCSILRDGYEATSTRAGISPLHVKTFYEPLENIYEQPGTPARTVTIPDQDDVDRAMAIIENAKEQADIVVSTFHWGVHFTHDLAMYQPELAYLAIDHGADVVLGTHPHCLQAVDVYKGKYIFYSLGNFAFEQPEAVAKKGVGEYLSFYGIPLDRSLAVHPHPAHSRKTIIVQLEMDKNGVSGATFIPVYFNDDAKPEVQRAGSPRYREIVGLMRELSSQLGVALEDRGGEVSIHPEKEVNIDARALLRRRKISYPSLRTLATNVDAPPRDQVQEVG